MIDEKAFIVKYFVMISINLKKGIAKATRIWQKLLRYQKAEKRMIRPVPPP
jgi:hypothetical protein